MVSAGRHIDVDARMIWMSLRSEARAMSAHDVCNYWSPTFREGQVVDALRRLVAGHHVEAAPTRRGQLYFVSDACVPLPGFAQAARRPPVGVLAR